ncbi:MAG: nucleotide exchange factor GrpE [Legionella sp.]
MSEKINKDWKKVKEDLLEKNELESQAESADTDVPFDDESVEQPGLDHPSYAALEEKLTLAEQKAHENWEKSVRAMAEADNIRRRAERDIENAHRYGLEKLINALLPVVDSLEQALQAAQAKADDVVMREGLELTMKLFLDVLKKHQVEQLDPHGQAFDPQQHEAMSMQQSNEAEPNTILAVFQKGYKLNDRVIRPARVIVSASTK